MSPENNFLLLITVVVGACSLVSYIAKEIYNWLPPHFRPLAVSIVASGFMLWLSIYMAPSGRIALYVFALLVLIGGVQASSRQQHYDEAMKKRSNLLRSASRTLGLSYQGNGNALRSAGISSTYLFRRQGTILNVMAGRSRDLPVWICDHEYTTGGNREDDNLVSHLETVFCFRCSRSVPDFSLTGFSPKTVERNRERLDRDPAAKESDYATNPIVQAVAQFAYGICLEPRINFEGRPIFNSKYELRAPDPGALKQLFAPKILDYFETMSEPVSIEKTGQWLLIYRADVVIAPDQIWSRLNEMTVTSETILKTAFSKALGA